VKVLVVDSIAAEGLAYLRERGFEVDELVRPKTEALYARIGEYDALITRSLTAVTPELLRHAPRLKIVGRAGVGVDNIDVDACSRRGIVVVNTPHGNMVSAAEHTVGMLLALVRHIPRPRACAPSRPGCSSTTRTCPKRGPASWGPPSPTSRRSYANPTW
jgi:D-3-phosphoglycerate dehydrogenase / 2-oxoglutarate reductase